MRPLVLVVAVDDAARRSNGASRDRHHAPVVVVAFFFFLCDVGRGFGGRDARRTPHLARVHRHSNCHPPTLKTGDAPHQIVNAPSVLLE